MRNKYFELSCQKLTWRVLSCVIIILGVCGQNVHGKNILFFIGLGSLSHRTALEPLAHKMVQEGHSVSFVSPIPPTKVNPKFAEFSTKEIGDFYEQVIVGFSDGHFTKRLDDKYFVLLPRPTVFAEFLGVSCAFIFQSPEFKPWVDKSHFDLIIIEHGANICGQALGYKFKAPVILFSASGFMSHEEDTFGIPLENSWLPNFSLGNVYTKDPTFYDKVFGTLYRIYAYHFFNWLVYPQLDKIVREALELPDMPPLRDLERDTRLFFINQHFSSDYARSLPPFVVPVGGMHCQESNGTLPKKFQDFVDGAGEDGFVFISFGTIVSMSKVPEDFKNALFDTVKNTKTRFLWKWDTADPPKDLPKNVLTATWFPQQDVLASPKIRAFVTHGGMMSTQQANFHGVPTVVIPVIFDQPYNAKTFELHETGIHVESSEVKEKFRGALTAVLEDKKYMRNAKMMAQRFKDRPMTPLDTAYFWSNYVLRHENVDHLKPLGRSQSWWERRLLDVWLFIFVVFFFFLFILFKIFKFLILFILSRIQSQNVKSKPKKA